MDAGMITAIGALIVGIASVISAIMLNRKTMALLEYRLGEVEKKLDSHNGYAKKFSDTTESLSEMRTDIAVIKTKLEYISDK